MSCEVVAGDRTRAAVAGQVEGHHPADIGEVRPDQAPVARGTPEAVDEDDPRSCPPVVLHGDGDSSYGDVTAVHRHRR